MSQLFEQPSDVMSTEALEASLANYQPLPVIQAEARSALTPVAPGTDEDEATENEEASEAPETGDTAGADTEEQLEPTEFASQFKQTFGVEPAEAIEMVNGLQSFREEMQLMRSWGVTPAEYDSRISQVRELYNTLPDEGKQEFNSIEGANAIWEFISKQKGAPTATKAARASASKTKTQPKAGAQVYKRSYFNSLTPTEYSRQLPLMQKAFLDGRIIEDLG